MGGWVVCSVIYMYFPAGKGLNYDICVMKVRFHACKRFMSYSSHVAISQCLMERVSFMSMVLYFNFVTANYPLDYILEYNPVHSGIKTIIDLR